MKKYVLTGGPGIGKTTVIEILASMGHKIIPETARIIIEEEKLKDSNVLPWKDLREFQKKVADFQLKIESEAIADSVFLDRSIIDGLAYCKIGKVTAPEIIEKVAKDRYEKVFVLDRINNYELDGTRFEDQEMAKKIHETIIEVYESFGYKPIFVQVLPPQKRVEFILNNLLTNMYFA